MVKVESVRVSIRHSCTMRLARRIPTTLSVSLEENRIAAGIDVARLPTFRQACRTHRHFLFRSMIGVSDSEGL
jgi:hypothetical protein